MAKIKNTSANKDRVRQAVMALAIALLFLNVLVLARCAEIIKFPGETSDTTLLREGAVALIEYYEGQATKLNLDKNTAVREALAKFRFETTKAVTEEDVAYVIGYYGRTTSDVMDREIENRRREALISIINSDPGVSANASYQAIVGVTVSQDGRIDVDDPAGILSMSTIENIKGTMESSGLSSQIDVEISGGKANAVTPRTMQDRLKLLRDESESLKLSLEDLKRTAGYSNLVGKGIVVNIYDSETGVSSYKGVWDSDIRNLVNELFAAGAQGVEVGGQRLIATSSIRAAGAHILVNQRAIDLNPVTIKAVGDPEVLESSLDIIRNDLNRWGIRVSVEKSDNVSLSTYRFQ